ncbi:MAG: phosphoribosylformimino-5-aminoimidazole carboxamide ribotide isomerase [Lachnospiraceae bacterium]|jgi:phosphoribosylformimino-5-aminoimidazole carboxamide ribotide isomerase|nr:phosphoribosylformimino-5-aminoimidazole carboxamide ribotide isomerase [Lachnospiraceae bacterium]
MQFRPCIDIHNGKVKQIVGSSLRDEGDLARENFVSEKGAAHFAELFRRDGLTGGHVILLNARTSPYYEATLDMALQALSAYPGGLQVGGGIRDDNAAGFIRAGASHVIVTSFVFADGRISYENLMRLERTVGREHLVLDLSCRKRDGRYYICTDRWQKFTDTPLDRDLLYKLSEHCDEYLVHGIDVEGKGSGLDTELVSLLAGMAGFPITYAGGIRSAADLRTLRAAGGGRIHATVGSALDIYGGDLPYAEVINICKK